MLGLDQVHMYDLRAPLDADYDPPSTWADAERMIVEGLALLGDEYTAILRRAFHERWVDRGDNVGKASGAFSTGVHGVHPYVLLTWRDNLRNVFLLAHELGHSGHQALAADSQIVSNVASPVVNDLAGGSSLFWSEAPSTINEVLLGRHLLETTSDRRYRRFAIEQFLGTFTHNMVTHLLEGHFEQRLYDLADQGKPITTRTVLDVQGEVFERFFGGEVVVDDRARLYWMEQPHFYIARGLYPHTYAAGLACACAAADLIRREGQPAVDRWLATLRLGSRLPPLELAAHAGIDMTKPEPLRRAVALFDELVTELEASYPS